MIVWLDLKNDSRVKGCQFHQHKTYKFFVWTYVLAAFTIYKQLEKAAKLIFVQKTCTKNVDEIDKENFYKGIDIGEFFWDFLK